MIDIIDPALSANPFIRKWEQAVHRQEVKGMAALKREIKKDTADLHTLIARGIRRICAIGKKLEAVKRLSGHGNVIEAWGKLGYSQPQANKYIQASQYEPLLKELQGKRDDPLGIGQAYDAAVKARRIVANAPAGFHDLEDPKVIQELAEAVTLRTPKKAKQRGVEATRNKVAQVIGELEMHMHESEARALVAQLHSWSSKVLADQEEEEAHAH